MDNPSSERRAKTRVAIQQARHVLLVVADLHKLGYECARVAPSIVDTPGGGDWSCTIAPASMISPSHGAIIDSAAWNSSPGEEFPSYAGRAWRQFQPIFDSAENLLRAFPVLAEVSLGRDGEYVAWYREMLRMTEPDGIIYARKWSDDEIPQTGMRAFGADGELEVLVPLPPPGKADPDSWYRAPDGDLLWGMYTSGLDRAPFAPVQESSRAAAEELLRDDPFLKIDAEKANEFAGSEIGSEDDGEYYLLRGLSLQEGTGAFTIYARGGQVLVYYGGPAGRGPVPMNRTAIVARLSEPPTEVYSICSVD